jgi:hypothetical protein
MPKLEWGVVGTRFYEIGVDRGVLYVDNQPGVAWTGLSSITENSSGGDAQPFYIDGIKHSNTTSLEEFSATLSAFTYPDEFEQCDGMSQPRTGLILNQQRRKPFGLSYRTKVGNDQNAEFGYKIHLIYGATVAPSNRDNKSLSDSSDPTDFSWEITTRPPPVVGYNRTAHLVIDSRTTDPQILELVEASLYGDDDLTASLPTFDELIDIFDTISELTITDNGDGTWTAEAPADAIRMLGDTIFEITASTAVFIDDTSYTISSS